MDGPLLDLSDPAVQRMIKLAKRRGYVTLDELDEILPPDVFSPEQIEDVISQLAELGIDIVGREDNTRAVYRNLAHELRAFAAGQRGQGRELLENSAKALDIQADEVWSPYQRRSWTQSEQRWFLVFDAQHGIQIAEHDPSGDWIAQGGQDLTQVTHWRACRCRRHLNFAEAPLRNRIGGLIPLRLEQTPGLAPLLHHG